MGRCYEQRCRWLSMEEYGDQRRDTPRSKRDGLAALKLVVGYVTAFFTAFSTMK